MVDKIADGVVVSLAYTMTVEGETIETATAEEPLDYLHGAENIVPGLENALAGKQVGDKLSITLSPDQAYGEYNEEDIEAISREDIPDADNLQPGMVVVLEDEEGEFFEAIVHEITSDAVVLDFNQPLAGKSVSYDVEVVALRPAEPEELQAGAPYGYGDMDEYDYEEDEYEQ